MSRYRDTLSSSHLTITSQSVINCQTVGDTGEDEEEEGECFTTNNRRTLMLRLR